MRRKERKAADQKGTASPLRDRSAPKGAASTLRPRRRLFWRIYLYGVFFLLAVGLAAILVHQLVGDPPWKRGPRRLARIMALEVKAHTSDPEKLKSMLNKIHQVMEVDLAVYTPGNRLLASAGGKLPGPLDRKELDRLKKQGKPVRRSVHYVAEPILCPEGLCGYLVIFRSHFKALLPFIAGLAGILLLLALVMYPLTRTIARPLEQISLTAHALGQGDLEARTGIVRKDEVGVLAKTVDDMAGRIAHLIRSEKELLANVSHEFRTPLSRMRVALALCAEEKDGVEALKNHLSGIGGDLSELEKLVADVLLAARFDLAREDQAGQGLVLNRESVNLAELAQEAAKRFLELNQESRLDLDLPAEPPLAIADPALLRRVLDNLLDNAAKYTEIGQPITLAVQAGEGEWIVAVRDRGIGVPEEELGRLFEPFYRTDRSRSRGRGGIGLGLTLCKRIVESHGGGIAAINRPERGTIIRFTLPYDL